VILVGLFQLRLFFDSKLSLQAQFISSPPFPSTFQQWESSDDPRLIDAQMTQQAINAVGFLSLLAKNSIVQGLENVEAVEGGEALFECYLSKPECYNYNWLIDDEPAKTTENTEMVYFENGRRHLLLLKNLTLQDNCRVTFMCSDAVTSAFLTVKGNC